MNYYLKRREQLMEEIDGNALVLIFSGKPLPKSEDEDYPFSVNRNFYYLTGIEREDMVLCMSKINGNVSSRLFIPPYDELLAKWVGGRMKAEEATEISGVEIISNREELDSYVSAIYNNFRSFGKLKVYFDLWKYNIDNPDTEAMKYAKKLQSAYPNVKIKDIYKKLTNMRLVKDELEIENIKKAIAITNHGIKMMMRSAKANMNEMMMEAIFNFSLAQKGCKQTAFPTIAASGVRATTLHYADNNQEMLDGELFLCDLGATYDNYCADISRTFPVNGKFTERQKEIYELVLNAQKIVEANAKPGMTTVDLNNLVIEYYKEELPKHGLNKGVSEYYFHGVSHHLGLDTHDVSHRFTNNELAEGNVITNEPGLYISDEGIGIRIENDLLITETGCINLSSDIVREVEDIEALMAK